MRHPEVESGPASRAEAPSTTPPGEFSDPPRKRADTAPSDAAGSSVAFSASRPPAPAGRGFAAGWRCGLRLGDRRCGPQLVNAALPLALVHAGPHDVAGRRGVHPPRHRIGAAVGRYPAAAPGECSAARFIGPDRLSVRIGDAIALERVRHRRAATKPEGQDHHRCPRHRGLPVGAGVRRGGIFPLTTPTTPAPRAAPAAAAAAAPRPTPAASLTCRAAHRPGCGGNPARSDRARRSRR